MAVYAGETVSEGGFKENKVSKAALLGVEEASDKKGKPYYKYELLTTTGAAAAWQGLITLARPCLQGKQSTQ